uniref:PKD domain-containing protein n=1 Tax=candidate division WOR-3 bacterium TaxID=2052148 RepID=A0A7C4GDI9_UNCW3
MRTVFLSVVAFALLTGTPGCGRQVPPAVPELGGPQAGQPGETLSFRLRSTDRNGGNVSYLVDWGDSAPVSWSAELAAGRTFVRTHVFEAAGLFQVRARARDETGLESDWAGPLTVRVAFAGPERPTRPEGPTQIWPDTVLVFRTTVGHIAGESVSVQFDWGDGLGTWTPFRAAGDTFQDRHAFRAMGNYGVRARGRDRRGNVSAWSSSLPVEVGARPVEPPTELRLSQSSGVYVRLRWNPGRNSDSTRYFVWFRSLDSNRFAVVDSVAALSCVHDPIGATGEYTVSARMGGREAFAAETLSTVPVCTDTVVVFELNAGGPAGYGWDSMTRQGRVLSMTDTALAGMVAWYLTDLTSGHNGPVYYLASPHIGPGDPGGRVPPANWPRSGLVRVWGSSQDPLPEYDTLLYQNTVPVGLSGSDIAVYVSTGHYALMRVFEPDANQGTCPVVSWFQPVRGLRLMRRRE